MLRTLLITLVGLMLIGSLALAGDDKQADDAKKTEKVMESKAEPKAEDTKKEDKAEAEESAEPELITTESGLRYQDLVVGEGVEAKYRMPVVCHYTLWLADSTGLVKTKRLQSSKDRGQPYTCTIGVNLIQGWSEGMVGMKEGGTRLLYVPWKLGYGERSMGNGMIPAKSNLIFEIDFLKAK